MFHYHYPSALSIKHFKLLIFLMISCGKKNITKKRALLERFSNNTLRLFQHTELEHTPSNLYQEAIHVIPFIVGEPGDCRLGVPYRGVLQFSWKHGQRPGISSNNQRPPRSEKQDQKVFNKRSCWHPNLSRRGFF